MRSKRFWSVPILRKRIVPAFVLATVLATASPGVADSIAPAALSPTPGDAVASPTSTPSGGPLRIMPLGDSITAGVGPEGTAARDGGYRGPLERMLLATGRRFVFVGGRTDYAADLRFPAHEGWPGYVVRSLPSAPTGQLIGGITRRALVHDRPDLILLMAGTNDLLRREKDKPGYTLVNIVAAMNELLGQIFLIRPHVRVILAGVVSSPAIDACAIARYDGDDRCGEPAPPSLRTLAARWAADGYAVAFVPAMETAVPRDARHFPDKIHPTGGDGYAQVARAWFDAIVRTVPRVEGDP